MSKTGDYRRAKGVIPWREGDEPAEAAIRRQRDGASGPKMMRQYKPDDIVAFIATHQKKNCGVPPTIRQIGREFGRSISTIYFHLEQLVENGNLQKVGSKYIVAGGVWLGPEELREKIQVIVQYALVEDHTWDSLIEKIEEVLR